MAQVNWTKIFDYAVSKRLKEVTLKTFRNKDIFKPEKSRYKRLEIFFRNC